MRSKQLIAGTILVADDQASNRELLEKVLTSPNGVSAFGELSKVTADLVLPDISMPRMNGIEVCKRIKANPDTCLVPVILITALSEKQDRLEGIKVGADDF